MILRLWIETQQGTEIPILLARRDEREAAKLFPPEVLAALVHDAAAPPWKDTLFNRPRSGLAVDPAILPNLKDLAAEDVATALRAQVGLIGPNIARSVAQWTDWQFPAHLVRLNSWWFPAGTARYPQGLFLIAADNIEKADLPNTQRVTFHAYVTHDRSIIPEWSFVLPCYITRLSKQGRLAVVTLAGASPDLQSVLIQAAIKDWTDAAEKFAAAGITLDVAPQWHMPLSEDATRGLWTGALAIESICLNHGILPVCFDGRTIVGSLWDTVAYQYLAGKSANIFEDVWRPSRIAGLRIAFPVGQKKIPRPDDQWFTLSIDADVRRGPYLPAVEAMWAEGNPPRNLPDLEKLASWLLKLVQMIPNGWSGQIIPGKSDHPDTVFDWLLLRFGTDGLSVVTRPFSAYTLPLEWLHAGPPAELTTTSTSTTANPCSGTCTWTWSPGSETWEITHSDCSDSPDCYCVGPQDCPGEGETVTPCGPEAIDPCTTTSTSTTTTQEPPPPQPCEGSCTYRFNGKSGKWEMVESGCSPADCHCDPSTLDCDHPDGSLVVRSCIRGETIPWPICTTTTPAPCDGVCKWVWDPLNKRWVISNKGCSQAEFCDCSPPAFCGATANDCAYTDCSIAPVAPEPECGQPKPPTTSTTTSSTSSTSPYPVCTGECRWRWFLGAWHAVFEESPCHYPCNCHRPTKPGESECDEFVSPCLPPPPPPSTSKPEIGCGGQCEYFYVDGQYPVEGFRIGWNRINVETVYCTGPIDCRCNEPQEPGYPCEIRYVECVTQGDIPPPTTPIPNCNAYCLWKYDSHTQTWSVHTSYCPSECPCQQPQNPPQHDPDCELIKAPCGPGPSTSTTSTSSTTSTTTTTTTTTSTTTTTAEPCRGQCSWMCSNGIWSFLASTCTESCQGCAPPQGGCADGAVANTNCIAAPTTTPNPNICTGRCVIQCICANEDCSRGVLGVAVPAGNHAGMYCVGTDCVCTSDEIGKPCNPLLTILYSGFCEKRTTTTPAPTTSTTTTTATSTSSTSTTSSSTTSSTTSTTSTTTTGQPTTSSSTSSSTTSTTTPTTQAPTSQPPTTTTPTTQAPTSQPPTTTTTSNTSPPSSSEGGCSACSCWWSWDDEYGWMLEGNCQDNGCSSGCSCNAPSGPGNYQGEWRSTQCY